jgi:magnesium-transporting ATPase (P-type)
VHGDGARLARLSADQRLEEFGPHTIWNERQLLPVVLVLLVLLVPFVFLVVLVGKLELFVVVLFVFLVVLLVFLVGKLEFVVVKLVLVLFFVEVAIDYDGEHVAFLGRTGLFELAQHRVLLALRVK